MRAPRRSGRVAEGGALLRRYGGECLLEGSNPSFSALRPKGHAAEGWQSGRMRRSRKPLRVVRLRRGFKSLPLRSLSRIPRIGAGFRPVLTSATSPAGSVDGLVERSVKEGRRSRNDRARPLRSDLRLSRRSELTMSDDGNRARPPRRRRRRTQVPV